MLFFLVTLINIEPKIPILATLSPEKKIFENYWFNNLLFSILLLYFPWLPWSSNTLSLKKLLANFSHEGIISEIPQTCLCIFKLYLSLNFILFKLWFSTCKTLFLGWDHGLSNHLWKRNSRKKEQMAGTTVFPTQLERLLFSNDISIVFNMAQGPFSSTFFIWPCVLPSFAVDRELWSRLWF